MNQQKANIDLHNAMGEFMKVDRMHKCIIEKFVKSFGIHRSQHRLLMYLSKSDGKVNQKDIAEKFEISEAAVSVTVKKLEAAGYIEKKTTTGDSRYNDVCITKKGLDIVNKSEEMFSKIDSLTFSGFTCEEIDTLLLYLKKMQDSLRKAESEINII